MRDLIPVATNARQEELTNDSTLLWFSAGGCSLSIDDVVRRYLRRCSLVFRGLLRSGSSVGKSCYDWSLMLHLAVSGGGTSFQRRSCKPLLRCRRYKQSTDNGYTSSYPIYRSSACSVVAPKSGCGLRGYWPAEKGSTLEPTTLLGVSSDI